MENKVLFTSLMILMIKCVKCMKTLSNNNGNDNTAICCWIKHHPYFIWNRKHFLRKCVCLRLLLIKQIISSTFPAFVRLFLESFVNSIKCLIMHKPNIPLRSLMLIIRRRNLFKMAGKTFSRKFWPLSFFSSF